MQWGALIRVTCLTIFIASCVPSQGVDSTPLDIVETEQTISGTDFGNPEVGGTDFGNPEADPRDQEPTQLRLIIGQLVPQEEDRPPRDTPLEVPLNDLPIKVKIQPTMQMSIVNIKIEEMKKIRIVKVCPASTVTAVNSAQQEITARIQPDCSFEVGVPIKRAYMLNFQQKNGDLVARLVVNMKGVSKQKAVLRQHEFYVGAPAEKPVNLGQVEITALDAIPANNPGLFTDRDGDGDSDAVDTDDDNDGVPDRMERNCDLDAFIDDHHPESLCLEEDLAGRVPVLQIYPFNGQTDVDLDQQVVVRLGCKYDLSKIDFPSDLKIKRKGSLLEIDCTNVQVLAGEGIECVHVIDPFAAGYEYEIHLNEIACGGEGAEMTEATVTSFTALP